jgi:hypothetical protein
MTNHQFSLFGFQKPKIKVPISAARIQEAKEAIAKKDVFGSVKALRDIRYGLENFEKRIGHKK